MWFINWTNFIKNLAKYFTELILVNIQFQPRNITSHQVNINLNKGKFELFKKQYEIGS